MSEAALRGLAQPDQRSCGPSSLVAARMLLDPAYAAAVSGGGGFAREALELHRLLTRPRDVLGRFQLPWPRALGTPPWAVARQMSRTAGPGLPPVEHDVRIFLWDRAELVARMRTAVEAGRPVPFYVGNRWLPRHIVLATGSTRTGLRVYDPARGALVTAETADFMTSRLRFGRWTTPWFVVLPDLSPAPRGPWS